MNDQIAKGCVSLPDLVMDHAAKHSVFDRDEFARRIQHDSSARSVRCQREKDFLFVWAYGMPRHGFQMERDGERADCMLEGFLLRVLVWVVRIDRPGQPRRGIDVQCPSMMTEDAADFFG
jgi:hypothetical protein